MSARRDPWQGVREALALLAVAIVSILAAGAALMWGGPWILIALIVWMLGVAALDKGS